MLVEAFRFSDSKSKLHSGTIIPPLFESSGQFGSDECSWLGDAIVTIEPNYAARHFLPY